MNELFPLFFIVLFCPDYVSLFVQICYLDGKDIISGFVATNDQYQEEMMVASSPGECLPEFKCNWRRVSYCHLRQEELAKKETTTVRKRQWETVGEHASEQSDSDSDSDDQPLVPKPKPKPTPSTTKTTRKTVTGGPGSLIMRDLQIHIPRINHPGNCSNLLKTYGL